MALLYIDGFEYTSYDDFNTRWQANSNYLPTILPTGGRDSSGAIMVTSNLIRKTVDLPVGVDIIVGVAFRCPTQPDVVPIFIRTNGGDYFSIGCYSDLIYLASGYSPIDTYVYTDVFLDEWNYLEVKLQISQSIAANSCVVRLNGVEVINLPEGSDTSNLNGTRISSVELWANDCIYDDFYICDSTGPTNNDFLGDCKVKVLRPARDGIYSSGTPTTGTSHFSLVNSSTYTSGTGIHLSSTGDKETFGIEQLNTASIYGGTIYGVQMSTTTVRSDGKGVPSVAGLIVNGSTEAELTSTIIPYSPTPDIHLLTTDINSNPWTVESVNATEFGIVIK